jgi:PKD repeat protein
MGSPLGKAANGATYNQVVNGHFYWYQEEWSNDQHSCLQRYTRTAPVPMAKFTVTAGSGLSMTFDASGSTAPGGILEYVWQFNDAFGAQTVQQASSTITFTFPASGSYSVGLTVAAFNGMSTGTGAIVTTGQSGFTPGFTMSPPAARVGSPVTFSGLTNVSREPVVNYLWEFGDGSTGSGAAPKHTYTKRGTFTVTVVEFSGVGSAFPGRGAAPIFTELVSVT